MTLMENPTDFEISEWRKEAKRLITCTSCYGSGEDRWKEGRACPSCNGTGKAIADLHVVRLCDEVERLRLIIDTHPDSYLAGAKAMREKCAKALENSYDAGVAGMIRAVPLSD